MGGWSTTGDVSATGSQLALLSHLFDYLPIGLVVLDREGRVVVYNRMEEQLAARSRAKVIGTRFFHDVAPCMNVRELGLEFAAKIGRESFDTTVELSLPFPHHEQVRDVRVRLSSLDVDGTPYGYLIVEDTSLTRSVQRMREKLQSLVVHDLKNPLAAIAANVELLQELDSIRDNVDAREMIEDALEGTRRLNRMLVNLLDLERLSAAELPVRRATTDLSLVAARIVNDNRATARAHGAILGTAVIGESLVNIDEDLTVRAVDNLVENALRHAKRVDVELASTPGTVTVTVRDDGPGIPAELRENLFERFVQVVTPGAAGRGANRGLGLTFVKLVARAHGGEVAIDCPSGGGSVFRMRVPT
jgi:photoactive yellow protein